MLRHPEEYKSSRFNNKYIPIENFKEYPIYNTIEIWIKFFISLSIILEESDNEIGYCVFVTYNGNGMYEIRFRLKREMVDDKIVNQNIPPYIQSEIENIINIDEKSFVDCDVSIGEIYVSFDYNDYFMNYVRKDMLGKLINKIKKNIDNS
jgi:hypothetical protein